MQSDRNKRDLRRAAGSKGSTNSFAPEQIRELALASRAAQNDGSARTPSLGPETASEPPPDLPRLSRSDSEIPSPPPSPIPSPPPSPVPSPPATPSSTRAASTFRSFVAKSASVLPPPPSQPPPAKPEAIAPPPNRPPPTKKLYASASLPASVRTITSSTLDTASTPSLKVDEAVKAASRPPSKAPPKKLSLAGLAAFKNRGSSTPEVSPPSQDTGTTTTERKRPAVPNRLPPTLHKAASSISLDTRQATSQSFPASSSCNLSSSSSSSADSVRPSISITANSFPPFRHVRSDSNESNASTASTRSESKPRSKVGIAAFVSNYARKASSATPSPPPELATAAERKSGEEFTDLPFAKYDLAVPESPKPSSKSSPIRASRSAVGLASFTRRGEPDITTQETGRGRPTRVPIGEGRELENSRSSGSNRSLSGLSAFVGSRSPSPNPGGGSETVQKRSLTGTAAFVRDANTRTSSQSFKSTSDSLPSASDRSQRSLVSDATLPPSWVAIRTAADQVYYYHPATQQVTWTRPNCSTPPPCPPAPDVNMTGLAAGWVALWSANMGTYYYYNPNTEESTWDMPLEEDENPLPPQGPPPALQAPGRSELNFINDVLRPKYGDGKLLTEPGLVESLFVYMVNNASQRHVIFCEFFLSCFRNENMLQQLLKNGWWKRCLLVLISEANDTNNESLDYISMSHNEILDYVLLTLAELFAYFFRHFEEPQNTVLQLGSSEPLPLGLSGKVTMYSFLMDAVGEFTRHRMHGITLKILLALNSRVCDWTIRPRWVTDFSCHEWNNLFSGLEAQEEVLFFHQKDFVLPMEGEFMGLALLESIVTLLERVKAPSLEAIPEVDPAIVRQQKIWAARGIQEYEFYSRTRDFFRYIGDMDSCMEKVGAKAAGIVFRVQPPAHCSQAEFCQLLLSRKRVSYGSSSSVQKKVGAFITRFVEHYKKVFVGEAQLAPRPEMRPFRTLPLINPNGSKVGLANFLKKQTSADRQGSIIDPESSRKNSGKNLTGLGSPVSPQRKLSLEFGKKTTIDRDDKKVASRGAADMRGSVTVDVSVPPSASRVMDYSPTRESPKPETSPNKKSLFKRRF